MFGANTKNGIGDSNDLLIYNYQLKPGTIVKTAFEFILLNLSLVPVHLDLANTQNL